MYAKEITITFVAWVVGLVLDANIGIEPVGFLNLRVVCPIIAMGICILSAIKENKKLGEKEDDK